MVPSDHDLLVLHGLRLKGFAEAGGLAEYVGLPADEVERQLGLAAENGFARHRGGARSGWSLTPEGRKENERLVAVELDGAGRRSAVMASYRAFLGLNPAMLDVCTAWQVIDIDAQVLNDHLDPAYDAAVVSRLTEIDTSVQPICAELGRLFDRFGTYGSRFSHALERVRAGHLEWFTKPTIESYHTVWFELHEDLLVTLGIDRTSERAEMAD